MKCQVNCCYTAVSCNRTPECADWGNNGWICYGACNAVALVNSQSQGVWETTQTLSEHTDRVNSVRWIRGSHERQVNEIISGSNDKTAIVWSLEEDVVTNFTVLKGHSGAITVVDGIYLKNNKDAIIATASTDSTLLLWSRMHAQNDFTVLQLVSFDSGFCLAVRLTTWPACDNILMAIATDDATVQLYADAPQNNQSMFVKVENLRGHEDWVRGLDFTKDDSGDVLLASSSQDTFIRLWRISQHSGNISLRKAIDTLGPDEDIQLEERVITVKTENGESKYFTVFLESVLAGHDGWVYGVNWHPRIELGDGNFSQPMALLSSSMDKTMIIWKPEPESGVWFESVRVGEVGGNTLGFYGSRFSPDGSSIFGHGYQGSFHIWNCSQNNWQPGVAVGGHFSAVTDLGWEPEGEFLITVGTDQSTRVHAQWNRKDVLGKSWHEIARPQVHGYDINCIAVLSRYCFASGAEEKVIRAFQAPSNFVDNFHNICNIEKDKSGYDTHDAPPQGASVPSLGLSNKAVYDIDNTPAINKHIKDAYPENYFVPLSLHEPPTEENLMQNTLWPEVQKLYGHGYEIFALAGSPDSKTLASACKATNAEHASVLIWDTSNWKQVQKLSSHQLTVTQIAFSPDNLRLLTVSRDRRWTLYNRFTPKEPFQMVATTDKKTGLHTRIIWCCAWTHDSTCFITGSRDGRIVLWGKTLHLQEDSSTGHYGPLLPPLDIINESITALALAPRFIHGKYLVAVGLDSGKIVLYTCNIGNDQLWKEVIVLNKQQAHHLTVTRLEFCPRFDNEEELKLASCGSDHTVKIHVIHIEV